MAEAIDHVLTLAEHLGGREGALVRTKLEEAGMWAGKCKHPAPIEVTPESEHLRESSLGAEEIRRYHDLEKPPALDPRGEASDPVNPFEGLGEGPGALDTSDGG